MEGTLKALNIGAKMLTRRCKAIGDILLATEEAAKILAGNKLTTKMLRLQTKYMGTRKTRITLHGVLMYITNNLLAAYFSSYGPLEWGILNQEQVGHCRQSWLH